MGNVCILVVFERYLSNTWTDPPMSADVPLPPQRFIGPWGWEEGELKTRKWGVVSFVLRTATISIFLNVAKCGSICRAQTMRTF